MKENFCARFQWFRDHPSGVDGQTGPRVGVRAAAGARRPERERRGRTERTTRGRGARSPKDLLYAFTFCSEACIQMTQQSVIGVWIVRVLGKLNPNMPGSRCRAIWRTRTFHSHDSGRSCRQLDVVHHLSHVARLPRVVARG